MAPHPLDRDDEESGFDFSSIGSERVNRHEGLFKASVRGAVVAAVLVFVSSIVLNNIQFPSPAWNTAFWLTRLTILLLLVAFVGLLLSFQLDNLIRLRNRLANKNEVSPGEVPSRVESKSRSTNSLLFIFVPMGSAY